MNSFASFMSVFCLSVTGLFFWPESFVLKGALLLLWSALGLMRGLWMAELVFYGHASEEKRHRPSVLHTLAGALSVNRGQGQAREISYRASSALTDRNLAALVLGGLYLFWMLAMLFLSRPPDAFEDLHQMIASFISRESGQIFDPRYPPFIFILGRFADVCMVGLCFWLAQSYASSYTHVRIFLYVALCVLLMAGGILYGFENSAPSPLHMSLSGYWVGYGSGTASLLQSVGVIPETVLSSYMARSYELGMGANVYLYVLGLYLFLTFLAALGRGVYQKTQAVLGLIVLLAMVMADRFLPVDPRLQGFWLAGWGALAVLSVQCRSIGHKSVRLHQG